MSIYCSYVRSTTPSHTQTLNNLFQTLTIKWEVNIFIKKTSLVLYHYVVVNYSACICMCICIWAYNRGRSCAWTGICTAGQLFTLREGNLLLSHCLSLIHLVQCESMLVNTCQWVTGCKDQVQCESMLVNTCQWVTGWKDQVQCASSLVIDSTQLARIPEAPTRKSGRGQVYGIDALKILQCKLCITKE